MNYREYLIDKCAHVYMNRLLFEAVFTFLKSTQLSALNAFASNLRPLDESHGTTSV